MKTCLRINTKAIWQAMPVVRLKTGREGGESQEMGRLWEQSLRHVPTELGIITVSDNSQSRKGR